MSQGRFAGMLWILATIAATSGCSSGGGGGGAGAAALPAVAGEWELTYVETSNDCGEPLESGSTPATIRQHGDVVDLEIGGGPFVGFLTLTALDLFGANDHSTWSFELTVSPSGDSFTGSLFLIEDDGVTNCNREYSVSGMRTATLAPLAAPIALPPDASIRLDTLVQACLGGEIIEATQLFVFSQAGSSVEIAIPGATGIVESFGILSGDRLRIHIESVDQGDREIRVGDLVVDASGALQGEIHRVVSTPAGLCGGSERWHSIPQFPGLTHSSRNAEGYEEYTLDLDPTVVLILIPGGTFDMGQAGVAEPVHPVTLSPYFIAKSEITNAQYQAYCTATGTPVPPVPDCCDMPQDHFTNPLYAVHPVVNVTWFDAAGYCSWAGLALPTEAQWEYAARGTDGRTFPWGNETPGLGVYRANYCQWDGSICVPEDGFALTNPVDSSQYSGFEGPFGTVGQAGNAMEWCFDWFEAYPSGPVTDPTGPRTGFHSVIRGGSWYDYDFPLQSTHRGGDEPVVHRVFLGFRPARAIP